jgi:hypothetical protein
MEHADERERPMCDWNIKTVIQDLILAVVINTSATLLAGAPLEWSTWYPFTCVAFATNVLAQLIIPTGSIARLLTGPLGESPARVYVQIFIENLIFVTIISLTEAFTQVGLETMIPVWWSTYLYLMAIGYVTSVILYLAFRPKGQEASA